MKDKEKKKICYIEEQEMMLDVNVFFINLFCYYNEFKLKIQLFIFIIKEYNIITILNNLDDKLNLLIKDYLNNYLYQNYNIDFNNNIIQINFNIKNNKQILLNEIDIFKKKIESLDLSNNLLKQKIFNLIEILNKTYYELNIIINK
tara:strand:- start:9740 stop:10177 length:438 start_codon:yes stop_codon:yes gene_type:complete